MGEVISVVGGMRRLGAGTDGPAAGGPLSEVIVNEIGLGRYFNAVARGIIFSTFSKAITVAATHNSPIAATTATPVCGFQNPANSGKGAVLLRAGLSTVSGTPAGGQAVLNVQANSKITAAATGSIFNHMVGGAVSTQGSLMKPLNNVALAGWTSETPQIELIQIAQAAAAAAAGNGGPGDPVVEELAGLVILPPGAVAAIMAGSGAGTTWIVNAQLTWAELDWSLIQTMLGQ